MFWTEGPRRSSTGLLAGRWADTCRFEPKLHWWKRPWETILTSLSVCEAYRRAERVSPYHHKKYQIFLYSQECRLKRELDTKSFSTRLEASLALFRHFTCPRFRSENEEFTIHHFADSVSYQVEGLVKKNKVRTYSLIKQINSWRNSLGKTKQSVYNQNCYSACARGSVHSYIYYSCSWNDNVFLNYTTTRKIRRHEDWKELSERRCRATKHSERCLTFSTEVCLALFTL